MKIQGIQIRRNGDISPIDEILYRNIDDESIGNGKNGYG